MPKKTITQLSIIAIVIGFIFLANGLILAWSPPSSPPPGGNAPAPLNVSNVGQTKAGGLVLNTGGAPTGLIVSKGNVGIGKSNPGAKLDVAGTIKTPRLILDNKWNLGTNAIDDGWLRIYNTAGDDYYGGLAADFLWAGVQIYTPNLCLSGDCRSVWPSGGDGHDQSNCYWAAVGFGWGVPSPTYCANGYYIAGVQQQYNAVAFDFQITHLLCCQF